jgi:proteasome lid subunit RPN8/RPN11
MIYFIQKIIRGFVAPEHELSCSSNIWDTGIAELRRRTEGWHESGAFLLGKEEANGRRVSRFVYYDDLDPRCLETGIVVFDGSGYGPLWDLCRETGMTVVADVHVHPAGAGQSDLDRQNPMIANRGHIALIVPEFAAKAFRARELGIYKYIGSYKWQYFPGPAADKFFYIGYWG